MKNAPQLRVGIMLTFLAPVTVNAGIPSPVLLKGPAQDFWRLTICYWLGANLKAHGLLAANAGGVVMGYNHFKFGGSIYVTDWRRSYAVLRACLAQANVLQFASLSWRDDAEGVWRHLFPDDKPFDWETAFAHLPE